MSAGGSLQSSRPSGSKRRLKQALEYVTRQWFPLNRNVFTTIQSNLSRNFYNGSHDALLSDMRSDFALYSYCLKKIKDMGLQEENPVDAIRNLSFEELTKILMAPGSEISKHDVASAEKGQALRLKCTVLSFSTAHMLAQSRQADSDLAYTCALVRQLGLNLIAWNYPSVYARAMSMVRAGTSTFDEALTDSLGFSPVELADEVIFGSAVHPLIRKASGLAAVPEEEQQNCSGAVSPDIVDICEISDAFAQLHDPEHHPHISRHFETIITQIDLDLGPGGAQKIMGTVNERYGPYITYIPEVFRADNPLENTLAKVSAEYTNKLFEQNTYAQRCPEKIKKQFIEVYKHVTKGQISSMGIGLLVNSIIPLSGFTKGCVYLLDNKQMTLMPKLRIGSSPLSRYKPVSATTSGSDSGILMEALYASMPIKQQNVVLFGDLVSPMIGPLGSKEPIGVLYLEMSPQLQAKDSQEILNLFRAIRHALNDCLNV
ncbi:MAG: hypothetical protein J5J00_16775 [Deltaproteobacteria bacterium]|nr:hypothetical protein [Deltaproteobacteria bacterium]